MDFVMGLPITGLKKNAIRVIVNWLTNSAPFLPIWDTWDVERLAELYAGEIIQLHEIATDTVSNKNKRLQAHFWQVLHKSFGTN